MKWHHIAAINKIETFTVQNFKFSLPSSLCFQGEKIACFFDCRKLNHGEKKNRGKICRIAAGLVRAWWPGAGLVAWCGPGGLVSWLSRCVDAVGADGLMMPPKTANDPSRWPIVFLATNWRRCIDIGQAHRVPADKNLENGADQQKNRSRLREPHFADFVNKTVFCNAANT